MTLYFCNTGYLIIRIIRCTLFGKIRLIHTAFRELALVQSLCEINIINSIVLEPLYRAG
jgi:hypothetical protein